MKLNKIKLWQIKNETMILIQYWKHQNEVMKLIKDYEKDNGKFSGFIDTHNLVEYILGNTDEEFQWMYDEYDNLHIWNMCHIQIVKKTTAKERTGE